MFRIETQFLMGFIAGAASMLVLLIGVAVHHINVAMELNRNAKRNHTLYDREGS